MRSLETVSCSLNLGSIYNVSYSYSPQNGVSMTIFFANESGEYSNPSLLPLQKTNIRIGPASFSLYAKSFKISKAPGRKVISVDFVDETFMLDNYMVVLTGRGCGDNIYALGKPVDKRTVEQKIADALDPVAQRLKDFTQFPDLEYSFDEFLTVLRKKFSVSVNASYNTSITRAKVGTFRDVLSDWCNFFNLAFYFENSQIKIYDPTRLTINIPTKYSIPDAVSYEYSEDISNTYGKTVSRYFEQEGGEKPYNDTSGDGTDKTGSSNSIKALTLYQVGAEYNLPQTIPDMNQVAAAMYGKKFWLLYNIANDSLSSCGWTDTGINNREFKVADVNEEIFNDRFEAYYNYGMKIAGKWYLSNRIDSLDILQDCIWLNEGDGQIFDVNSSAAEQAKISLEFLQSPDLTSIITVRGTEINQYFSGINFYGKRVAFFDSKDDGRITNFTLSDDVKILLDVLYKSVIPDGNDSVSYSSIAGLQAGKNYQSYKQLSFNDGSIPSSIRDLMKNVQNGNTKNFLNYRYASLPVKGVRKVDMINKKDLDNQPTKIEPVSSTSGNIITNTGLICTKKNGAYSVYYDKYSKCVSKSSSGGTYFGHHFDVEKISDDNVITFKFDKTANTYTLNRNVAAIDSLLNNPYLQSLAQPRTFPMKTASFTLNYYYAVPSNFLSNGLVNLNLELGPDGVNCSYTFSNSVLQVPDKTNDFENFESFVRNSFLRKYNPTEVITT